MFTYTAYGLRLHSDLELTPLEPIDNTSVLDGPVVTIKAGDVPKDGLPNNTNTQLYCHINSNSYWLHIPGIARFLVTQGKEIIYQVYNNSVSLHEVALFIQSQCIAIACQQNGFLVLQASAVRFEQHAVLFAGCTGSGKSTIAAAFHKLGFDILCDDFCVIDDKGYAYPGYSYLKIWQQLFKYLKRDSTNFDRIRPNINKYIYPLTQGHYEEPLPIKAIYYLRYDYTQTHITDKLTGLNKLNVLQDMNYLPHPTPIKQLTILAQKVQVAQSIQPKSDIRMSTILQRFIDEQNIN